MTIKFVSDEKIAETSSKGRPLGTTFTRQMNSAQSLYGEQIMMPKVNARDIRDALQPLLAYYAERDRSIIADRVTECILLRQKA